MNSYNFNEDLTTLGLDGCNPDELTMREVIRAYRKTAMKVDPVKADEKDKEKFTKEFQKLESAYRNVLSYLHNKVDEETYKMNDIEKFTMDNFKKINFPQVNKGSFTVIVEDAMADRWEECIEKLYGIPTIEKSNGVAYGKYWKVPYVCENQKTELTVHFYNKPKSNKKKSSILVQGS